MRRSVHDGPPPSNLLRRTQGRYFGCVPVGTNSAGGSARAERAAVLRPEVAVRT